MFYSFQFRENTDVLRYKDWGRIAFLHNFEETYHNTYLEFGTLANNHPPGSLYIISGMYNLQIQVAKVFLKIFHIAEGDAVWINVQLLYSFLRLPSILADLTIGVIIYVIIKSRTSKKNAILGSSFFLFNPVVIYNSAFWGQMDSVNNLFFITALFLLTQKKYFFSILALLISFYVKLSLIFFIPILLIIYYLQVKNRSKLLLSATVSVIFIIIATLPISNNPANWLYGFVTKNGLGEINNITAFAFNFWWMIFSPLVQIGSPDNLYTFSQVEMANSPLSSDSYFGFTLMQWSLFIFGILLIPILIIIIKLKREILKVNNLFLILSLVALTAFVVLPKMHERYMYPVFPLLAVYIGLKNKFIFVFLLLSLLNFINLYMVWHPMMISILSYEIMNNHLFQWTMSFFTVLVSAIFYIKSIKILYAKEK